MLYFNTNVGATLTLSIKALLCATVFFEGSRRLKDRSPIRILFLVWPALDQPSMTVLAKIVVGGRSPPRSDPSTRELDKFLWLNRACFTSR